MNNIMIDIETAATSLDATILSIGVVTDDGYELYIRVDSDQPGRAVSISTMLWWAKQDEAMRKEAFSGTMPLETALRELSEFLQPDTPFLLWAKPPQFDLGILENAYNQHKIPVPWNFRQVSCFRTVQRLFSGVKTEPAKHSAIEDARDQMDALRGILRTL